MRYGELLLPVPRTLQLQTSKHTLAMLDELADDIPTDSEDEDTAINEHSQVRRARAYLQHF